MTIDLDRSLLISDPMCVLDPDGRVLHLNASVCELLSWDRTGTRGVHHHDLWPFAEFDPAGCPGCEALDRIQTGSPLVTVSLPLSISGRDRCFDVVRLPLWNGCSLVGAGMIFLDRTHERRQDHLIRGLWAMLQTATEERPPEESTVTYGPGLTWREREVLHCMVAGMNAREIAARLSVTHHTARNHVRNILHKLEAHSKAQAVAHAVVLQLIDAKELATILAEAPRSSLLDRSA